jgi:hypothetical protein
VLEPYWQPANSPRLRAPQQARTEVKGRAARAETEGRLVVLCIIPGEYSFVAGFAMGRTRHMKNLSRTNDLGDAKNKKTASEDAVWKANLKQ